MDMPPTVEANKAARHERALQQQTAKQTGATNHQGVKCNIKVPTITINKYIRIIAFLVLRLSAWAAHFELLEAPLKITVCPAHRGPSVSPCYRSTYSRGCRTGHQDIPRRPSASQHPAQPPCAMTDHGLSSLR